MGVVHNGGMLLCLHAREGWVVLGAQAKGFAEIWLAGRLVDEEVDG